jgi:hypothetical protein
VHYYSRGDSRTARETAIAAGMCPAMAFQPEGEVKSAPGREMRPPRPKTLGKGHITARAAVSLRQAALRRRLTMEIMILP